MLNLDLELIDIVNNPPSYDELKTDNRIKW